jgi:MFS family permease
VFGMKLRKELFTIAIAQILVAISMGLVGPFYSLYFSKITQNINDVSLLIGIYWVFVGILEIPTSYFADRLGKSKVFLLGGILNSVCVFLYPFVSDFKFLAMLEIIGAVSYSLQTPTFYSLLAEATTKRNRTREVAFVSSLENIFYGVSAIIAGVIISIFGFSFIFSLASMLSLGSSVIVGKKLKA